jgi:hypothetical protein
MKMARALWLGAVTLSAAVFLTTSGQASAAVLFSDNLESSPIGNDTVGAAPIPDVGAYSGYAPAPSQTQTNSLVALGGSGSFPAASTTGGANFMRIEQAGAGNRNSGLLSEPATIAGTTFHYELEYYVSSAAGVGFGIGSEAFDGTSFTESFTSSGPGPTNAPTGPNTRPRQSLQIRLTGGLVQIFKDADGSGPGGNAYQTISGLSYTANTWQTYSIDYVIGSNQLTITAGANSAVITDPFASIAATTPVPSLSRVDTVFVFTVSTGAIGYADNLLATGVVPEPTALGILGLAGLLAARRPRSRSRTLRPFMSGASS